MLMYSSDQNTMTAEGNTYAAVETGEYSCKGCEFDTGISCSLVDRKIIGSAFLLCAQTPRIDGRSVIWVRQS